MKLINKLFAKQFAKFAILIEIRPKNSLLNYFFYEFRQKRIWIESRALKDL